MSATSPVVLTIPQNGNQSKTDRINKVFPNHVVKKLSITQLVFGALATILQVKYQLSVQNFVLS